MYVDEVSGKESGLQSNQSAFQSGMGHSRELVECPEKETPSCRNGLELLFAGGSQAVIATVPAGRTGFPVVFNRNRAVPGRIAWDTTMLG
jgi:hypothetical protein